MRPIRVLTWHIHGSYLYYLAHARAEFFVPIRAGRPPRYRGLPAGSFRWPANLHEVPAEAVPEVDFDCVLTQSKENYLSDRHELLSDDQLRRPLVHLEHDPPREHPVDQRHFVDDPNVLLVHVTAFNDLMWDSGSTPTRVIEHGVKVPTGVRYTGKLERGIVAVNGMPWRGRRVGLDVFERVRKEVPLDLIGMESEQIGGLGDVPHVRLHDFEAQYRFFLHPIRYTSLGLAVCEAMMLGIPIVGLATTEMSTAVRDGETGFVDTRVEALIERMHELLRDPDLAMRLGEAAREVALERFAIERFARDWERTFADVTGAG